MKFDDVHAIVRGVPFIGEKNARYLYNTVLNERRHDVLELGFAHGTATCYIAAALDELGTGKVTSVDLIDMKDHFKPSLEQLLAKCGLERYVDVVRMQTGYNWFLHDTIVRQTEANVCKECFDLCIIDGPKNWTIDGSAFFCVDKLLVNGGKIIFDDYNWTYSKRTNVLDGITIRNLSDDERNTPQIREVVHLLVMQHPNYGKVTIIDDGAWVVAEKNSTGQKVVEFSTHYTPSYLAMRAVRGLKRRARSVIARR